MDWAAGYVAEIGYTHGFYREIAPTLIDFALLLQGVAPPARTGGLKYLELGYGQGFSTNILGAVYSGDFWGTDMNPAHASNAQMVADTANSPIHFFDQSIEEFAARDDLPEFDYITMHGLWTWVSKETQNAVCNLLRKRLKVGGVFYVSYNSLPGWAQVQPLRHLLSLYAESAASDANGILGRVDAALQFGKEIVAADARFFAANPAAAARLHQISGENRQYVIHEYFNQHWTPTYFSEVEEKLSEAKVGFAGSATLLETINGINFTAPQLAVLSGIGQSVLRETVRDYLLNQAFRRDLYVRGARELSPSEQAQRLANVEFVLVNARELMPTKVTTHLGELQLKAEVYEPIADALADDEMKPKSINELLAMQGLAGFDYHTILEALTILTALGFVHPTQSVQSVKDNTLSVASRLTGHILEQSRFSGQLLQLPSPVIGSGIPTNRFEQMFLYERSKGVEDPADWGKAAWKTLQEQGQRLVIAGQVLQTDDENLAELIRQATEFSKVRLPALLNLLVLK